jgi:sulfur relay (sulfurtransferase) DsrF/TusC family protein
MKVLNIIEKAYRATIEEQDDPVVWIVQAMTTCGADLAVLLRGNAVNYMVRAQQVVPLVIGRRQQKHAPRLVESIENLIARKVPVYVDRDDLRERGLREQELIEGPKMISRADLPGLFAEHDRVWHW